MAENSILSARQVSKRFGGLQAVDRVSFEVEPKGVTSIIGPNGAGKSTVFNLISGTFLPDSGEVVFDGKDVTHQAPEQKLASGMARSFQITNLFFDLSVIDNLRIASQRLESSQQLLKPFSKSRLALQRTDELISEVELERAADQLAGALSHGDQRRLEIAVTLATRPRLLMLDEPSQGMSQADTQ